MNDGVVICQQMGHHFLWIDGYLWMWDTEPERQAQKELANQAYGRVLVAGYGLGLVQRYLITNPKVTLVVTAERYPEVLAENRRVFGHIVAQVEICDFYDYPEDEEFDCVIGDVWEDLLPEALADYRRFYEKAVRLVKSGGKILAWGQEYFEQMIEKAKG